MAPLEATLRHANLTFAAAHPGEPEARQPVHVVYGGAQLFKPDTMTKLGALARRALEHHAPDAAAFAAIFGLDAGLAARLRERVAAKLAAEPVEDYRIDFEDGYGHRSDADEDGHARAAAAAMAEALAAGALPPFSGIRIKPVHEQLRGRAMRTLDLFVTTLAERSGGALPPNFAVAVPKITVPEQVVFVVTALEHLETVLGLPTGALKLELMIETPQAIMDVNGRCTLPALVAAAGGRCVAAHFGPYDYTAALGIISAHQSLRHPACDFARHIMQVALAGTGVRLADGPTTVLPVGETAAVRRAWRLHYDDARASLAAGFYQGWDLHPAQLVSRYAAVFGFFLEGVDAAGARLRNLVDEAARATLVGGVFDDAATGFGLLNYFARGIACGALGEDAVVRATGLSLEDLRGRSFARIATGQRGLRRDG